MPIFPNARIRFLWRYRRLRQEPLSPPSGLGVASIPNVSFRERAVRNSPHDRCLRSKRRYRHPLNQQYKLKFLLRMLMSGFPDRFGEGGIILLALGGFRPTTISSYVGSLCDSGSVVNSFTEFAFGRSLRNGSDY